jgi:hypothetical protein
MSYNTAENYPMPFAFNVKDEEAKPKKERMELHKHPLTALNVDESYYYGEEIRKDLNYYLIMLRKRGRQFKVDSNARTYTRIL